MAEQAGHPAGSGRRHWLPHGDRSLPRWPRWPAFFLAALVVISLLLRVERSRRREEIRGARGELAATIRFRPVDGTKARRVHYYKARFFLSYPAATSFAVADFIRRLTAVFRPREILELRIDPGLHGFDFQLSVAVAGGAPAAMPWRFAGRLEELRNFPEVARLSFSEQAPVDAAGSGRPAVFVITGQSERQ